MFKKMIFQIRKVYDKYRTSNSKSGNEYQVEKKINK